MLLVPYHCTCYSFLIFQEMHDIVLYVIIGLLSAVIVGLIVTIILLKKRESGHRYQRLETGELLD